MEGADHVLTQRVVHTRLTTHGRINLRQQRGRNLNKINATLVAGCREPGHVADHATAERHQAAISVEAIFQEGVKNPTQDVQGLVFFAVRQDYLFKLVPGQRLFYRVEIQRCDRLVTYQHDLAAANPGPIEFRLLQQLRTNVNRVAAVPEVKMQDSVHGC